MSVCSIAVELNGRDGETSTQWFGVVGFGRIAEELAQHEKGEALGVNGRVQVNSYTKGDGTAVTELQIVADNLVSARTVRPGGKRKPSDAPTENREPAGPPSSGAPPPVGDFDDDIPF